MRSSIACVRCRRSKVKCVNNGVGTTCRSCENSGRECAYPSPIAAGSRRRDSISARPDGHGHGGEAERRQRPRKSTHTLGTNSTSQPRDSPRPQLDALDRRLLTTQLWQELFDIFQIHYSADLPFLHPPTFLKPLRTNASSHPTPPGTSLPEPTSATPPFSEEFLLAFLALTARFHPTLVQHHSPPTSARPSNPLIASEYYAAAANERLANIWTDNRPHDIERIQAILMLGLHEWGMCRGAKAWLTVGLAIRAAQAMGLQYEMDLDDAPMSRSRALTSEAERMGVSAMARKTSVGSTKFNDDGFILQEIRRRTFWSCYIMDRYLSSGKYRPQMLYARELRIQLPASERSFVFAEKVRTLMLGEEDKTVTGTGRDVVQSQRQQSVMIGTGTPEPMSYSNNSPSGVPMVDNDDRNGRLEAGPDEGLVSRYIKLLEIYGRVVRWSCYGGRRTEEYPPWDDRSEFWKLRRQCLEFKASLPRQHILTPQNTQAHISLKTSTPYTLVHTVYLLCQIMLHREYVPFIPIRCPKPEGPVDAPMFPPDKYDIPPDYWAESARDCFRPAREIMDLVRTCQEWGALVETPIIGFALYTVAFVGVYCINFPWMDPEGYMCTRVDPSNPYAKPGESKGFMAARKALEMIGMMRNKLHMADGWFKTINRMHKYLRRIKADYRKNAQAIEGSSDGDSPVSTRHLSLREGGLGGGLDEFKMLERTIHDFGNLEDEDIDIENVPRPDSRALDAIYDDSSAGSTVKSEEPGDRHAPVSEPPRSDAGAWSAINTGPGAHASRQPSISTPGSGATSAQFRSYESYVQQHQSQQQPSQAQAPLSQQQPPPNQHPISSFRPAYSEGPSPVGAPPSLTSPSPASHSANGTTPSQAQSSSPYERHSSFTSQHQPQGYGSWQQQQQQQQPQQQQPQQQQPQQQQPQPQQPQQNGTYQMHPPPPNPYVNGTSHHYPSSAPTPYSSYHSANPQTQRVQPPPSAPPPMQQQMWDHASKEAWLDSIDTRLGGDDIAAFVDGGEVAEWANMAANQGFGGGWLTALWSQGGQG